jgi:hypothetical protein
MPRPPKEISHNEIVGSGLGKNSGTCCYHARSLRTNADRFHAAPYILSKRSLLDPTNVSLRTQTSVSERSKLCHFLIALRSDVDCEKGVATPCVA